MSDTFQEKGEYTLREILRFAQDDVVVGVKKVKIFSAFLQISSYIASRGLVK